MEGTAGLSVLGVVVMTHSVLANEHPNDPQYNFEFVSRGFGGHLPVAIG